MTTWPADCRDPAYSTLVLSAVTQRTYEITWVPLPVSGLGHTIQLLFSADAMKIDNVRVEASATLQQQVADGVGAMLPTPKIFDLAWLARSATIAPATTPVDSLSATMVKESQRLDTERFGLNVSGIVPQQKTWAIGNSLLAHPGMAMNYGFPCIPNQPGNHWSGIATEAMVSITNPMQGRVIQGQGWAHNLAQFDYSQLIWLVHRWCVVDGKKTDLATVLVDPVLSKLVSHEGPLDPSVLRQPGVPQFTCELPPTPTPGIRFDAGTPSTSPPGGLCPMPPEPLITQVPEAPRTTDWGLVAVGAASIATVTAGFLGAIKLAGRAAT